MKTTLVAGAMVMLLVGVTLRAQAPAPKPGPELEKLLNVWVGEWSIQGQAKASPSGPDYRHAWTLQSRRILGSFFLEVHHTWKSQGAETNGLEILGYDPDKKHYTSCGFGSDGGTWTAIANFEDGSFVLTGTVLTVEGKPARKIRNTFTFNPDRTSFSLKGEQENDGAWWTSLTAKGTKAKAAPKK